MQKNIAGQHWTVFAFNRTNNVPQTGDAANITANIRIDGGVANAIDDLNPTELEDGYYIFDVTEAETNGDYITIMPVSTTADIQVIGVPASFTTTPADYSGVSFTVEGLDICNDALILIGDDTVLSIDPPDDNDRARACKRLYPRIRDEVLRAYPWNCAKTRATLTRLAATPTWGYTYQFQFLPYPTAYGYSAPTWTSTVYAYKVEGRVLLTDEDAVNILYIARVTDPAQFDSLLMGAMTARLAAELSPLSRRGSYGEGDVEPLLE